MWVEGRARCKKWYCMGEWRNYGPGGVGCRLNTPQLGWCGRCLASALSHLPPGAKDLALTLLVFCQAQHLFFSPTLWGAPLPQIRARIRIWETLGDKSKEQTDREERGASFWAHLARGQDQDRNTAHSIRLASVLRISDAPLSQCGFYPGLFWFSVVTVNSW